LGVCRFFGRNGAKNCRKTAKKLLLPSPLSIIIVSLAACTCRSTSGTGVRINGCQSQGNGVIKRFLQDLRTVDSRVEISQCNLVFTQMVAIVPMFLLQKLEMNRDCSKSVFAGVRNGLCRRQQMM
jgi:hypothetical protein